MPGIAWALVWTSARELDSGARVAVGIGAAAVTAYAANDDRERARSAGFDRHVSKPIDPAAIVEAVLSMRRQAEETS